MAGVVVVVIIVFVADMILDLGLGAPGLLRAVAAAAGTLLVTPQLKLLLVTPQLKLLLVYARRRYAQHVGSNTTFRVLNNMGWKRAWANLVEHDDEVRTSPGPTLPSGRTAAEQPHGLDPDEAPGAKKTKQLRACVRAAHPSPCPGRDARP